MRRRTTDRPQSTIAPLTPKQLRGIAADLLRQAKRDGAAGLLGTKYRERAEELRRQAAAIEQRARERRWYAAQAREWMKGG